MACKLKYSMNKKIFLDVKLMSINVKVDIGKNIEGNIKYSKHVLTQMLFTFGNPFAIKVEQIIGEKAK